ncbi:MAG: DNA/RNA non-specific endonuclease [Bacteroidaceae bacterium]|nr:DNA/RNA non-specific endonuclease [Bacteroidaceae bacterium]MBP3832438.1 DNA/RNA non-specific endonuclease [Bacteroidaceae bacterium]
MSKKKKQNTTKYAGSAFAVILAALLSYFPISKQLNKQETVNETQKQEVVISQDQQQNNDISLEEAVVSVQNLEIPAKLKDRSEKILKRSNYTISYNRNWNQPNWVAWELNKNETKGRNNRNEEFTADPDLAEAYQVESYDYSGSGYDRGHMCPAGDNHFDAKAMNESFYMSNICPQNHELNAGKWNDLEIACRKWANRYQQLFIVCGPIIDKRNGKRIGKEHEIIVPEKFFKVILITSTKPARAIGYIFENNGSDRPYKVHSIDEVEKITGMDFFPNLPDKIEDLVESRYEASDWRWYN